MKAFVSPLFRNSVYAFLIFVFSLCMVYFLLDVFGYVHTIPNENNLLNYDAKWYHSIATEGYKYMKGMCNIAFFPLFPLVWKTLKVSEATISLFNFCVFAGAFVWLFKSGKFSIWSLLFILTLPSTIFFALPYSEAVFFLSGAMILVGLHKNSSVLQAGGFLLASIARSVSVVFVPAIIILFFLSKKKNWRQALQNIICCLSGTLIAATIQFMDSGRWFYFLDVQRYWGRRWTLPSLPFTTHNPSDILGADVFALIIGFISLYMLLKYIYEHFYIMPTNDNHENTDQAMLFCMLYVCAVAVLDSCFTNEIAGKANLWSINRHILATPFGAYFILTHLNKRYMPMDRLAVGLSCFLGLLLTQLYRYPQQLLFYAVLCSCLFLFHADQRVNTTVYRILILMVLLTYQVYIYQVFLSNNWVG